MKPIIVQSSVSAETWAPVQDALLNGVVPAANNRVAALGGILQLQELEIATPQEGIKSVRDEFAMLRTLMERFRELRAKRGERKEPARLTEALRGASLLLAQHAEARQWTLKIAEEPRDVEPVLLWPSDPMRFAVLLVLAGGPEESGGAVEMITLQNGPVVELTLLSPVSAAVVELRPECIGLRAAAVLEGGTLTAVSTPAGVAMTLGLPGLSAAAARV